MKLFSRWRKTRPAQPPEGAGLPFTPVLTWICGTCRHSIYMHSPLGHCEETVLHERYDREPCTCQVNPEALAAFLKSDPATRIADFWREKI